MNQKNVGLTRHLLIITSSFPHNFYCFWKLQNRTACWGAGQVVKCTATTMNYALSKGRRTKWVYLETIGATPRNGSSSFKVWHFCGQGLIIAGWPAAKWTFSTFILPNFVWKKILITKKSHQQIKQRFHVLKAFNMK